MIIDCLDFSFNEIKNSLFGSYFWITSSFVRTNVEIVSRITRIELFFSEEYFNRHSLEVKIITQSILYKSLVAVTDILRKITEYSE